MGAHRKPKRNWRNTKPYSQTAFLYNSNDDIKTLNLCWASTTKRPRTRWKEKPQSLTRGRRWITTFVGGN